MSKKSPRNSKFICLAHSYTGWRQNMRKTGNYKGVSFRKVNSRNQYECYMNPWGVRFIHKGIVITSNTTTEKKAALIYDKLCIKAGLPPVNILKPVK